MYYCKYYTKITRITHVCIISWTNCTVKLLELFMWDGTIYCNCVYNNFKNNKFIELKFVGLFYFQHVEKKWLTLAAGSSDSKSYTLKVACTKRGVTSFKLVTWPLHYEVWLKLCNQLSNVKFLSSSPMCNFRSSIPV